jgi:hypothetical protein
MCRKILVNTSGQKFYANPSRGPVTGTYKTPVNGALMQFMVAKAEQERQCRYNVILRRVRVPIVAVEKQ